MIGRRGAVAAFVALLAGAGCSSGSSAKTGTGGRGGTTGSAGAIATAGTTGAAGTVAPADAGIDVAQVPFGEQILAIAAEYVSWGRVDDELRWAPWLCRAPYPGIARPSQSNDEATHGRKLYSVFAKNHAAYPNGPHDGQVVVKQSWIPELIETDAGLQLNSYTTDAGVEADHFYP